MIGGILTSGIILETEAYLGRWDPACHAYRGRRHVGNRGIWSPPEHWYIYRSYGVHWCLNLVSEPAGEGAAVLIRALLPREGIPTMAARRGKAWPIHRLADGPGKLCQALGATGREDGLRHAPDALLHLRADIHDTVGTIRVTPRIGITRAADWPLRFVLDRPFPK